MKKLVSKQNCPTVNHWYTQLTIRQKTLRRHPTRTSKTSNYVRCWLHHCFWEREENEGQARAYHSERESLLIQSPRNPEVSGKPDAECVQKREGNTQRTQAYHSRQKACWQVRLESSKFQGNLMRCFRATVNRVRTRFPKETKVTNRETDSRVVFILLLNFLMETKRSFAYSGKV